MKYEHRHRRALACLIDIFLPVIPIMMFVGTGEGAERQITLIATPLYLIYMILTEGIYGQSLGKKLFGIKVLMVDGSKCSFKAAIIINLLRIIDALQSLYIVGILAITFTEKRQRIGDLAAKTVVVRVR